METVRKAWTDERLDDLAKKVDSGFARMDSEFAEMRGNFKDLQSEFNRRFDILTGAIVTGVVGLIVAHVI
jgi:hypothetical protein